MSRCACDEARVYRVTGEVWDGRPAHVGDGKKAVRVRCLSCGGKVGTVGSDLLELLGIDEREVRNGRALAPDERVTLEVDLC